ncbi:hypothetical protein SDC9_182276 [bioreactor metagenome]|uniref:Uncharacterized protein n=1 Tax=bioreactor metagenome TaxID=1076179 RepID=A0A645H8U0_9ZZZZ
MHAADAAGCKDGDAREVGDDHGGGNSARSVPTLRHQNRQIPAAGLGNGVAGPAQIVDLLPGKTRLQAALDNGNGGGNGPVIPDDFLHVQRRIHVLGIGHAVGNDGGFQRHDGFARIQRGAHFGSDIQIFIQHNDSSVYN